MLPNLADFEEGTSMDQRDSEKKKVKIIFQIRAAREAHIWSKRNGVDGRRAIHRGHPLLVWVHSILTEHLRLSVLRVLLTAASHVEKHREGNNRERNDGSDNTYRVCGISHSFNSKSKLRDVPPTIAPTLVLLLPVLTLGKPVGSGTPVEPRGVEVLVRVLIGFGFSSGSPDQNL